MDKKKFEQIISKLATDYVIDTVPPVKGIAYKKADGTIVSSGPRRRVKHDGEERDANETGYLHIVTWHPTLSECRRCNKLMANHEETINVINRSVRCKDCGQRYSLDILKDHDYNK
jgi:DNA-directed RNA polymerase subunit RPC12/RpoP